MIDHRYTPLDICVVVISPFQTFNSALSHLSVIFLVSLNLVLDVICLQPVLASVAPADDWKTRGFFNVREMITLCLSVVDFD